LGEIKAKFGQISIRFGHKSQSCTPKNIRSPTVMLH